MIYLSSIDGGFVISQSAYIIGRMWQVGSYTVHSGERRPEVNIGLHAHCSTFHVHLTIQYGNRVKRTPSQMT